MQDPRIETLASNLIHYSVRLQPGQRLLIEANGPEQPLCKALLRAAYAAGGRPYLSVKDPALLAELLKNATAEQLDEMARWEAARMREMDAYIGLRRSDNIFELAAVPAEKMSLYNAHFSKPVHHDIRVRQTNWVVLRYPDPSMAQLAGMNTDDFTDYYFRVCNLDYAKLSQKMQPLVELMTKTEKVRITGPGTDLSFSIAGIPAVPCDGRCNIPDGEVYSAPLRDSVNGTLRYNVPSQEEGVTFHDVCLRFEQGRIVEATAGPNTERLNAILDTDAGARYIGEFALGVNPMVTTPINDILFDEKIAGSFHFTPGSCYEDANNGNQSAIHWDLVCMQDAAHGGGEIWFDDRLIRKDGRFVLPELQALDRLD